MRPFLVENFFEWEFRKYEKREIVRCFQNPSLSFTKIGRKKDSGRGREIERERRAESVFFFSFSGFRWFFPLAGIFFFQERFFVKEGEAWATEFRPERETESGEEANVYSGRDRERDRRRRKARIAALPNSCTFSPVLGYSLSLSIR
jgi:hypothetical protein